MLGCMADEPNGHLPCGSCPVTLGKRNQPVAANAVWCKHCPFLAGATETTAADGNDVDDFDEPTPAEGMFASDRVRLERRIINVEKMVAAALPRNEFVLYVENTQENIAKFYTHYFAPVNIRSVVALVIGFIGLALACIALTLLIVGV